MNAEAFALFKDIAIILLVASGFVLCVTATVVLIGLFPPLRRTAYNTENITASTAKIASDLAAVSEEATANLVNTTASMATTAQNLAGASKNILDSSEHLSAATSLLRLLGPAGKAVDFAELGVSKIPSVLRTILRRN